MRIDRGLQSPGTVEFVPRMGDGLAIRKAGKKMFYRRKSMKSRTHNEVWGAAAIYSGLSERGSDLLTGECLLRTARSFAAEGGALTLPWRTISGAVSFWP